MKKTGSQAGVALQKTYMMARFVSSAMTCHETASLFPAATVLLAKIVLIGKYLVEQKPVCRL